MKVIKATQQMLETRTLVLGFQGENLRTQLRIDCSATFAEYPNATPALAIKPPTGETYPVFVDRDGTEVVWDIVANNLILKGDGELQLTFYKDNVIAKTSVGHITVNRSLQIDGEMPDVVATWIENANRKLAEVDAQIVELEGMVDTATDAAERAEQSASTASTKAEQTAGSAATATEKATEATNAAGTATAKAAEAQTAAQTATDKANAAAESERIATAKAGEATTAAGTATAKAEQATEAAETATEKAGDASASATAAHASEINAAESADGAFSAEVGANAAKRAAETSATQAGISEQNAGIAAQTATQKAAEATQSATDAAIFAGTATTKAEEATEAAQAASDAQTAVEQTAEQLAESLEQIAQNTQDIADLDERKANIDGYYPDMTVGNAEQLNSSKFVENSEPYTLRTSGVSADIGNREYVDAVVGGTLAWNQAVRDEASENSTDFAEIVTVTDAVEDNARVKVKLEPVQDLHGYDHPWPAGGGKNLLSIDPSIGDRQINGLTVKINRNASGDVTSVVVNGTATSRSYITLGVYYFKSGTILNGCPSGGAINSYSLAADSTSIADRGNGYEITEDVPQGNLMIVIANGFVCNNLTFYPMIRLSSMANATFVPYSNICPITGWDEAKVTRMGANAWDEEWLNGYYVPNNGNYAASNSFICSKNLIRVNPSTSYYFRTNEHQWEVLEYDSQKNFLRRLLSSIVDSVFTTSADAYYINIGSHRLNDVTTYNHDVSINYPSTDTEYHAYSGQTYSITLPTEAGTVYGGTLDVSTGELVVDTISAELTGTAVNSSWDDAGRDSMGFYTEQNTWTHYTGLPDPVEGGGIFSYCYNGQIYASNNWWAARFLFTSGSFNRFEMRIPKNVLETVSVAGAKAYLNEHPLQVVYKVAPQTYTLTPTEIRTLLGTNNVWADTGDVALTYTGTDEHLTLESGKKYLARISGTDSMLLGSGQEITAVKGTDNVFDLTQMFGTAVADYIYGQGAAFFRKWFPNAVYPYNAGELKHVEGLQSHDMVGFNLWDEEWENGVYNYTDGSKGANSNVYIRSKNFVPCLPNTTYSRTPSNLWVFYYDIDKNYVGYRSANGLFTTPNNCYYITFNTAAGYGGTYKNDICISLAHNNSRNGEYEPYEKHSYPLDSSVILRGIPKVGANGVYWDGDRYLPDGTVERRYGVVDLGTLNWTNNATYADLYNGSTLLPYATYVPSVRHVCNAYLATDSTTVITANNSIAISASGQIIYLHDSRFSTLDDLKAAMHGIFLVYELATPTTETAQPYHSTQWVSDWGTEEFVSTGIIPVGHETRYPANLRDKLQHLPDAASGNGSYLITQTDGQMVLTPFPAPPSTAGNYVLKATVTGGVATYTWEVAT